MANILPEVQPIVTSMPGRGYELQTGGSARRSFIKNNNNTYFIHGVPGHTHNASAMISVTADYSKTRDILSTIGVAWADEEVELRAEDYTDSREPNDKNERYDRAIERGIGRHRIDGQIAVCVVVVTGHGRIPPVSHTIPIQYLLSTNFSLNSTPPP